MKVGEKQRENYRVRKEGKEKKKEKMEQKNKVLTPLSFYNNKHLDNIFKNSLEF